MKKIAIAVCALIAISASAQTVQPSGVYNYLPNAAERVPAGATGPGVVYTQRAVGKVIAVGAPIVQDFPVGQVCQQVQYQQPQQGSSINAGTVIGTIAGGIIGAQVGQGDGRLVATAIGAATGAVVGNNLNQAHAQANGQVQCQTSFERRITGYSFTAQYESIQMQGSSRGPVRVGQDVEIIIHSTFYAGN